MLLYFVTDESKGIKHQLHANASTGSFEHHVERQDPQGEENSEPPCTPSASVAFTYSAPSSTCDLLIPPKPSAKSSQVPAQLSMPNTQMDGRSANAASSFSSSSSIAISSLLPDNFSLLSSSSQQALIERLLAISQGPPFSANSSSNLLQEANALITEHSQNSGICKDVSSKAQSMEERGSGVGAALADQSPVTVVSLPNHSSSLNIPDSPGPATKNELV